MKNTHDAIVVGGGMVGAAMALGLAQQGKRVAVVETHRPQPYEPSQQPDLRVSAISAGSISLLRELGAWEGIQSMRSQPYRRLAVWEDADCRTEFNAAELSVDELGHIVENRLVQLAIHRAIDVGTDSVDWFWQRRVSEVAFEEGEVLLDDNTRLRARWVVAADGLHSSVRAMANIGVTGWQYGQQVLALSIRTDYPSRDITWQQFHPSGPTAYLPLFGHFASLVWYNRSDEVKRLKNLSKTQLKTEVVAAFADELGDFEVLESASFPIRRQHAQTYGAGRVVLVGDAAHSINPLAGQGVNLGFKDVRCLLDLIKGDSPSAEVIQQYEALRKGDNALTMAAMDGFYLAFSNDIGPLKLARNLGLKLADKALPLKSQVMKYAMGL